MTKMRSKKMTKSTLAIIIMSIAMVAMLAFGGTYAYFTATTVRKDLEVTTGTVMLSSGSTFASVTTIVPTEVIANAINYTDKSDVATFIFVTFSVEATGEKTLPEGVTIDTLLEVTLAKDAQQAEIFKKLAGKNGVYYVETDGPAATAGDVINFATSVKMANVSSESVETEEDDTLTVEEGHLMGIELTITLHAESIQALGFNHDAAEAYAALNPQA